MFTINKFIPLQNGISIAFYIRFGALWMPPVRSQAEDYCPSSHSGYHWKGAYASFGYANGSLYFSTVWFVQITVHIYFTKSPSGRQCKLKKFTICALIMYFLLTRFGALWMPPARSQAEDHCQSSRSGYHWKGAYAGSSLNMMTTN